MNFDPLIDRRLLKTAAIRCLISCNCKLFAFVMYQLKRNLFLVVLLNQPKCTAVNDRGSAGPDQHNAILHKQTI